MRILNGIEFQVVAAECLKARYAIDLGRVVEELSGERPESLRSSGSVFQTIGVRTSKSKSQAAESVMPAAWYTVSW